MAAKESKVSVPVTLELRQSTYDALTQNIEGGQYVTTATLANRAAKFFEELASGGMVLTSDQVQRIETAIKKQIRNGNDVVNAATQQVGIEDGVFAVKIKVDPANWEPLAINAKERGCSVDELMSEVIQFAFSENWFCNVVPASGPLWMDSKDIAYMRKLTGKESPTGTEIAAAVRGALKEEKAA